MDVGGTTTRKWEVELRLEQQPRITQELLSRAQFLLILEKANMGSESNYFLTTIYIYLMERAGANNL